MHTQRLLTSSSTTPPTSYAFSVRTRGTAKTHRHRSARAPAYLVGALLLLMPCSGLVAALLHQPMLVTWFPLAFLPLLSMLLLSDLRRAAIQLNMLTASVVAYAVLVTLSLLSGPHGNLLAAFASSLAPLALFFIGMMLPIARQTHMKGATRQAASPQPHPLRVAATQTNEIRLSTQTTHLFGWLAIGAGLLLALLTLGLAQYYRIEVVPPTPLLSDAFTLANILGLVLILSMSWDSRRRFWALVLGHTSPYLRVTLAIGLPFYLLALGGALVLTWSNSVVMAMLVALLGVSLARRRLSEIAVLSVLAMPLLILTPHAPGSTMLPGSWLTTPQNVASVFFNGATWNAALNAATATPLGAGVGGMAQAGATDRPQYLLTLRLFGLPGLMALLSILAIALYQCWRSYRRLRSTSSAAGGVLAAWGMTIFVVVAGLTTAPLNQPLPATFFWLFLGLANAIIGTVAIVERQNPAVTATHAQNLGLRGYPLRVGFLVQGNANGDLAISLYDHLRAYDRRRVIPLALAVGPGALANSLGEAGVHTRIIRRTAPLFATLGGRKQRFMHGLLRMRPIAAVYDLMNDIACAWGECVEWTRIMRTLLEMDLDILVCTQSRLYIPGLLAGRLAGVPVQWRVYESAPKGLQFALDALAPWTDGVLAESQTVARSFNLRVLGAVVRVLRPGLHLPPQPTPQQLATVRQAVDVEDDAPLVLVMGPVTATSGHDNLLEAIALLMGNYPHARVVLASTALPGSMMHNRKVSANAQEQMRLERLQRSIRMRGLDGIVCNLGACEDIAAMLTAADVVVFPQRHEEHSYGALLAMATGTPIIATYTGVFPELLHDAWGCQLVPPRSPASLASAIVDCLENHESYQTDAQRNPWLVRDRFAPQTELAKLYGIYRCICRPTSHRHNARPANAPIARRPMAYVRPIS